jgi:hypothetical protein
MRMGPRPLAGRPVNAGRLSSAGRVPLAAADASGGGGYFQYGPELIANGHFTADTTGWTGATFGVLTVSGGVLRITNTGGINGRARSDAFATTISALYEVRFNTIARTATAFDATIRDGAGAGVTTYDSGSIFSAVAWTFRFVAITTTHTLNLFAIGADTTTADYDNVSIRQVM